MSTPTPPQAGGRKPHDCPHERLQTRVPCVPCPSCGRSNPGQGGAYFGPACSLGENCCTVELPSALTPAPTLTAEEETIVDEARRATARMRLTEIPKLLAIIDRLLREGGDATEGGE